MIATEEIYRSVLREIDAGNKVVVTTVIDRHSKIVCSPHKIIHTEKDLNEKPNQNDVRPDISLKALRSGRLQFAIADDGCIYMSEPYFPGSRLVILGGGHIAKPLADFSSKCGFSVYVTDDRPSFANIRRFPDAKKVICESFDRCFSLLNINSSSFVVIITRGHRHDIECLRQILNYQTAYTGMIGSKRRVAAVKKQLINEGFSEEKLNTVKAPIGLDIGAITPEEIAVSILSEAIMYKRRYSDSEWSELDLEVLEDLSAFKDDPRAVATIIETRGSVPRNIGAKITVYPYGKIIGSIGGGCSEGAIIRSAYDVIRTNEPRIEEVDMSGAVAENSGMVCGGTMKVLIEPLSSKSDDTKAFEH
ncbi:MAG: XdhC family protein [Synergistaceae bacterium]|nr:XdhC family protein [Synergistaceae bacterium]